MSRLAFVISVTLFFGTTLGLVSACSGTNRTTTMQTPLLTRASEEFVSRRPVQGRSLATKDGAIADSQLAMACLREVVPGKDNKLLSAEYCGLSYPALADLSEAQWAWWINLLPTLITKAMIDGDTHGLSILLRCNCPDFIAQSPIEFELAGMGMATTLCDTWEGSEGPVRERIRAALRRAVGDDVPAEGLTEKEWVDRCREYLRARQDCELNWEYPMAVLHSRPARLFLCKVPS